MTQERLYSRQTGMSVWVVLVVLVVLAALGAGGWWGWQQFQQMQKEKAGLAGQISELKAAMASQRSEVQGVLSSFEKKQAELSARMVKDRAVLADMQSGGQTLWLVNEARALASLADPGSADYVALAALLALMVGVTRLLLGVFRLGVVTYLMRDPVVAGFTSAAAILILASQLPKALGTATPSGGVLWRAGWSLGHPGGWEMASLAIATTTVLLVLAGRRVVHRMFPGALIAVGGGVIVSRLTDYAGPVVGDVPTGLPSLSLDLPWGSTGSLLVGGILIALVGFAEPASIARVFADEDGQRWSANREFVSQGVANVAAAVSGSFPVGGSFSRSSLNRLAGARTRWSGMVTGITARVSADTRPAVVETWSLTNL